MFAKKSLGQNFLKSKAALRAMVETAEIKAGDLILEIGPGKGVLTESLLETEARVCAIEKDDRLIDLLHEKFSKQISENKLELIHGDALEFGTEKVIGNYKIIANIPYYITGAFFKKYLTAEKQPEKIVVMVQKEVAQRIVAKDGKESLLSLSVKCFGEPKYVMTVNKKYFSPEPKVDSAVISINNISQKFFDDISSEEYFEILKLGFQHKRKVLIGNLQEKASREELKKIFSELSISENTRAEDLSLENWKKLAQKLNS